MAEDRDYSVKLSAKGGSKAAKEVERLENAIDETRQASQQMRQALDAVEGQGPEFDAAMERMGKSVADLDARADAAEASLRSMTTGAARAGKGSANMGMAVLEASRAFEDMQYGIRGVLNNIPILVTSLGMGSGIAGVISIVAVAATSLVPKLLAMADGQKAVTDQLEKYYDRAAAAAEKASERIVEASEDEIDAAARVIKQAADKRVAAYDAQAAAAQRFTAALRAVNRAELERDSAAAAAQIAQIDADEASDKISSAEAIKQRAAVEAEMRAKEHAAEIEAMQSELDSTQSQLETERKKLAARNKAAQEAQLAAAEAAKEADKIQRLGEAYAETTKAVAKLEEIVSEEAQRVIGELGIVPVRQGDDAANIRGAKDRGLSDANVSVVERLEEAQRRRAALGEELGRISEQERAEIEHAAEAAEKAAAATQQKLSAQQKSVAELQAEYEKQQLITESRKKLLKETAQFTEQAANTRTATRVTAAEEREAAEAQRAAEQADRERAAAAAEQVNRDAAQIAAGIERDLANSPAAEGNAQLLGSLQRVSSLLSNGTSELELIQVTTQLATAAEAAAQVGQNARARVDELRQRIAKLESQLRTTRR